MNQLGDRNYRLIVSGVKMMGTFNPNDIFDVFYESLYMNEVEEIWAFLDYCHKQGKTFGHGNYEERFTEFQNHTSPMKSDKNEFSDRWLCDDPTDDPAYKAWGTDPGQE